MEDIMKDDRFSAILKDPRFKKIPIEDKKIKIDKRFKAMFKDKNFKLKYVMDKRGRPVNYTTSEDLKKFYDITSSESSSEESDEVTNCEKALKISSHTSYKEFDINEDIPEKGKQKLPVLKQKKNEKKLIIAEEKNKKHKEKKLHSFNGNETCMKLIVSSNNKMSEASSDSKNTDIKRKVKKESWFDNANCTTSGTSSSENSDVEQDNKRKVEKEVKLNTTETSTSNSEQVENKRKLKKEVRFNDIESSSDTETSSSGDSDSEQEDELDHKWGELDRDAPPAVEITRRLAVCNMDWDRIQNQDLFVLFNSFKPADGLVKSVKLYPTEYGLKRMKQEEIHGPVELVEKTLNIDNEDVIEENEDKFLYQETVRQYQLNRLKYYYAVVECDAPETANTLYEELDGMEYENSGVHLDLRFIPDDFVFEKEEVSTIDSLPDSLSYKPSMFENAALAQTTVNLTWDETDPRRKEIIERAFADPENPGDDVLALIAPPSSDSSENEEEQEKEKENEIEKMDRIALYRSLLQALDEKEDGDNDEDIDMEITFEPGLKEKAEKLIKEKQKEENLTPFEQYIQKKKDKQKLKKKERKAKLNEKSQLADDSDDEHSNQMDGKSKLSYSNEVSSGYDGTCLSSKEEFPENEKKLAELALMTSDQRKKTTIKAEKKKKKIKKRKEPKENEIDDFEFNAKDPRFAALYTSHLYNIDPSDPHYKDTKGMRAILEEKQKRKLETLELENNTPGKHTKLSEESIQLLKSVKRKMNK